MQSLKRVTINGCMVCLFVITGWNLGGLIKADFINITAYEISQNELYTLTEDF